jgi:hypothetical protein
MQGSNQDELEDLKRRSENDEPNVNLTIEIWWI